jgi:Flp pilus assembly protein TadG
MNHHSHQFPERRGAVAVLASLLMVALVGFVAFAVDLGYLANSQTELQRTADAAALVACSKLIYTGTPGTPVDLTSNVAAAPGVAATYAAANKVCGSAPALSSSDVVMGYMANPGQPGATIQTGGNINQYNAVQVTVHRTSSENGLVPGFFGKIFGVQGEAASATATAAFLNNFGGFQAPKTYSDGEVTKGNLMILPFALDQDTYKALLDGTGSDNWAYNASTDTVSKGCDGILEVNLFPEGTGSPGNRGTVNIGSSNNSTATLCRQIQSGISPSDLAYYPDGKLVFDSSGNLYLNGNTGISAGCKSSLASIVGQTRMIPIFTSVTGNGNNAEFDCVAFVGVRVLDVNLTGSMSTKHLTVQPARVFTRGTVASLPSNGPAGASYANSMYSPVWLVK